MKILAVADEESKSLWDYYEAEKLTGYDLIISCGDLKAEYLEFLVTMVKCPVLYIPGNHDSKYVKNPPQGCVNIDGRVFIHNGVRIFGLGGCMKYKPGPYMYTEKEMRKRIRKAKKTIITHGGVDIFVTHAPAKGQGDLEDLPHQGFECFCELMDRVRPVYMLHGHVHGSYSWNFQRIREYKSGTTIVNAFDKCDIDYEDGKRSEVTGGTLFKNLWGKFW